MTNRQLADRLVHLLDANIAEDLAAQGLPDLAEFQRRAHERYEQADAAVPFLDCCRLAKVDVVEVVLDRERPVDETRIL